MIFIIAVEGKYYLLLNEVMEITVHTMIEPLIYSEVIAIFC
jgi:hypothetical protein